MRFQLFLHILPVVAVLVAWAHQQATPPLRIAVVESLTSELAAEVVQAFEAEVERQLDIGGRRVAFVRQHVAPAADGEAGLVRRLRDVDLVVSFGRIAAIRSAQELTRSTTRHVVALFAGGAGPYQVSAAGEAAAPWSLAAADPTIETVASSIARRLLASRAGPPLRVGVLHQASAGDRTAMTRPRLGSSFVVSLPITQPNRHGTTSLVEQGVTTAIEAASGASGVDAYWLALDQELPLRDIVQAIVARTGKPVLYAASRAAVATGALFSVAPEPADLAREAARVAARLLDGGAADATLSPVARRISLALNLTTARALGIVPPHDLLELSRGRLFR